MDIISFVREMDRIAPPDLAEEFDEGRIGLVVEGSPEITTVCSALDATPYVVREAAAAGAEMLVVHHTPLWHPVTRVTGATSLLLKECLSAGMNVFVMHTNFDRAPQGVNDTLAALLGLSRVEEMPLGVVGDCSLSLDEIARRCGGGLRIFGRLERLERLAVVGGSGFDLPLITEAARLGADAFLSAEVKHGVVRASPIPCIESTHYALEAPAMRALADRMGWRFIDDPPLMSTVP